MLRVLKIGGSLLGWADFPAALRCWLDRQPPAVNLLVVGGGEFVEALRELDRVHGLGEETCHELAIHALGVTARVLSALFPEAVWLESLDALPAADDDTSRLFIRDLAAEWGRPWMAALPASWDVTSDSLAAALAVKIAADEVVLLKSRNAPTSDAAAGYVDQYFPSIAVNLPLVSFVNLRSELTATPIEPLGSPRPVS